MTQEKTVFLQFVFLFRPGSFHMRRTPCHSNQPPPMLWSCSTPQRIYFLEGWLKKKYCRDLMNKVLRGISAAQMIAKYYGLPELILNTLFLTVIHEWSLSNNNHCSTLHREAFRHIWNGFLKKNNNWDTELKLIWQTLCSLSSYSDELLMVMSKILLGTVVISLQGFSETWSLLNVY